MYVLFFGDPMFPNDDELLTIWFGPGSFCDDCDWYDCDWYDCDWYDCDIFEYIFDDFVCVCANYLEFK